MHTPFLMRLSTVSLFVTLALGGVAHAQSAGSCMKVGSGMFGTITANVGLATQDPSGTGNITSVAPTSVPYVFGDAECQCKSATVYLQLQVLTTTLPVGATGTVEVWVGTGCDNYTTRTTSNQNQCYRLTALNGTTFQSFANGANNGGLFINIPVDATHLFSPGDGTCPQTINEARGIFVILVPSGAAPQTDYTLCSLNLTVVSQGASMVSPVTQSGDGAITLSWPPITSGVLPTSFQILCADANGDPVPSLQAKGYKQYYSTCIDGTLVRRTLPNSGSTTGVDLGTGSTDTPDLSGTSVPLTGTLGAEAQGNGNPDGSADVAAFAKTFDPRYLCSDNILAAAASSFSTRLTGLTNNTTYQFAVVSIDQYGNAVASDVVPGMPQPTEDLYHRYYNAGGRASGFCFVATAAYGSYESRWVRVLRDFRDEWLLPTPEGRVFVDWYYEHSPPAADWIAEHDTARRAVRVVLLPVIAVAAFLTYVSPIDKTLLAMALVAWLVWRGRRRVRLVGAVS